MTVACFYTNLHPLTRLALQQRDDVQYCYTSEGTPLPPWFEILQADGYVHPPKPKCSYGNWLHSLLDADDDLICIEQDMEVPDGSVESLLACDQDWCTYSYQGPPTKGFLYRSLGFVKLSARLQQRCDFSKLPECNWKELDTMVWAAIDSQGYKAPHVHGSVKHYHNYMQDFRAIDHFAYERQPSNEIRLYNVNPDGSRGHLIAGGAGVKVKREISGYRV